MFIKYISAFLFVCVHCITLSHQWYSTHDPGETGALIQHLRPLGNVLTNIYVHQVQFSFFICLFSRDRALSPVHEPFHLDRQTSWKYQLATVGFEPMPPGETGALMQRLKPPTHCDFFDLIRSLQATLCDVELIILGTTSMYTVRRPTSHKM